MNLSDLWVVEYSISQGCFHFEPLDRMVETNRRMIANGTHPQYAPLAIVGSHESCREFAQQWEDSGYAHNKKSPLVEPVESHEFRYLEHIGNGIHKERVDVIGL